MKTFLKYIFSFLLIIASIYISKTYADYSGFLSQIKEYDFDTSKFAKLQQVPRYDVVRLLNYVDCQDCTMPAYGSINKYTRARFSDLQSKPWNYFNDITQQKVLHNDQDIYYCLSYVADKDYMNWFTVTSPVCSSQFCWERNTTYADLIEVMTNIITTRFSKKYSTNRSNIRTRLQNTKKSNPIIYQNFNIEDLTNIYSGSKLWKSTLIKTNSEIKTYIKYCTYEPKNCWFSEFTYAKAAQRPVANLNLLVNEWILTSAEANAININLFPDGHSILNYIYRLNQKSQCKFNNDYDGDWIENRKDKDPFVDRSYTWAIYTGKIIVNSGDVIGALQIKPAPIICPIGTSSLLAPYRSGNIDKITRNMNNEYNIDNQTSNIIYKCDTIWSKTFTAKSYYKWQWIWVSQANIYVVKNSSDIWWKYASNLLADKIVAKVWENINFTTNIQWFSASDIDHIDRFMTNTNFTNTNINTVYSYNSTGKKIVIQNIILKNWYKLQNAVTVYIYDPNDSNIDVPPIIVQCEKSDNCPEYSKFDSLKFGDKVRAILQPKDRDENYVYTDRKTINQNL